MTPKESLYPADWLRIAEKDWQRVERLLKENDPDLAGFCLQQAIEKFLKAFLLSRGWELERIHNLDTLIDEATNYDTTFERYRSVCQKITGFYVIERYPFISHTGLTEHDVQDALSQVKGLIEIVRVNVGK